MKLSYLLLILFLTSCIGIPTEYPEIEYYSLSHIDIKENKYYLFDYSIKLEDVNIPSEFESLFILEQKDKNQVEKYIYHRWLTTPDVLYKNYLNSYLAKSNIFKSILFAENRSIIPDITINANIVDFKANKIDNNVYVIINFVVTKNNQDNSAEIILNKNYEHRVERENNKIRNIPVAYNKAINMITNSFINDLINSIK